MRYTLEQGKQLIDIARKSIEFWFKGKELDTNLFKEKKGVFVTLYIKGNLKGCIGLVLPYENLGKAVIGMAREAAFNDSRFKTLNEKELKDLTIEISVLTVPELLEVKPEKYSEKIKIGRDGLIVGCRGFSGLLLPQVAKEHRWDTEEFLRETCLKAGLLEDNWKKKGCEVYTFQAQVFKEMPDKTIVEE
ncbi:MAG: AmmeMemoRadiSam system protein A [Candidatus Nanoarchaeia archaeon]|nr:AmmeMemoRadiSam system protein A [Candidatus Nanoarchaeia archaeon]